VSVDYEENLRKTYFGLRLGLVVLALLLALSILIQIVSFRCLQSSISAYYYYTPVRSVFVAALCAIGAGLVIYRGSSPVENALLDIAGFLAFVIAFVPTPYRNDDRGCHAVDVPGLDAAILNNMLALIVAGGIALGLARLLARPALRHRRQAAIVGGVCVLLWVGLAVSFLVDRPFFLGPAHKISAAAFFALILAVIWINQGATTSRAFRNVYRWTFFGAIALGAVVGVLWLVFSLRTTLFWLEAIGITAFIAFWVAQTGEMRGYVDRADKLAVETARSG
jgi:hypothetical protein